MTGESLNECGLEAKRIGAKLTPPLEGDVRYLRSIGYRDAEIVRRGIGMLATHERQSRAVPAT